MDLLAAFRIYVRVAEARSFSAVARERAGDLCPRGKLCPCVTQPDKAFAPCMTGPARTAKARVAIVDKLYQPLSRGLLGLQLPEKLSEVRRSSSSSQLLSIRFLDLQLVAAMHPAAMP